MSEDGMKSPISVGIGASLSVKAEVPEESVGRSLDALVDIIRPFTEKRGLKADQIRLQRAEVAYEIAKIAIQTAELEHLDVRPPPTKFMVPFLERASLEDQDIELHSRWAALLLSASTHYEARHLTFIDILSRLSSQELSLLEEVCVLDESFPLIDFPDNYLRRNARTAEKASFVFNVREAPDRQRQAELFAKVLVEKPLTYGRFMHAILGGLADLQPNYTEYGHPAEKFRSLEILEREKLVEFGSGRGSGAAAEMGWFSVTFLGVDFVRDCSPRGREAARNKGKE